MRSSLGAKETGVKGLITEALIVAVAGAATLAGLGELPKMKTMETFGRVAWTDGGLLVQEVEVTTYDAGGEVLTQKKYWEVVRKLSDAESIRLKTNEVTNGFLVKDLTIPGANLRKEK